MMPWPRPVTLAGRRVLKRGFVVIEEAAPKLNINKKEPTAFMDAIDC